MFFLLYRHTDDSIFDNFLKISNQSLKIFQNYSVGQTNVLEYFPKFSKIAEDFQEDPKMSWSYTNEFNYTLRDKLDNSEITDIFTSEDMENTPLESRM